jgi:co-chaperonin GroES (HSP10)
MAQAIQMQHETDPRDEILTDVASFLPDISVMGARLLVAPYIRSKQTRGGIFLPDNTRAEDKFQGKVGLVLALGPLAFRDDETHRFGDKTPKVGDWIVFAVGDTFGFELGTRRCRAVEDVDVHLIVQRPDIIL